MPYSVFFLVSPHLGVRVELPLITNRPKRGILDGITIHTWALAYLDSIYFSPFHFCVNLLAQCVIQLAA